MKVSALCTKLINLAGISQHKNIPLTLHGNGRKDREQKITEKGRREKKKQQVDVQKVYEKAKCVHRGFHWFGQGQGS